MLKPKSLRQALYDAVPKLKANPDMLRIFIDSGVIGATLAASLSFENRYTLNVIVKITRMMWICCWCRLGRGCGRISPIS